MRMHHAVACCPPPPTQAMILLQTRTKLQTLPSFACHSQMAELAGGQRVASPVKQAMLAQPPIALKPISEFPCLAWLGVS